MKLETLTELYVAYIETCSLRDPASQKIYTEADDIPDGMMLFSQDEFDIDYANGKIKLHNFATVTHKVDMGSELPDIIAVTLRDSVDHPISFELMWTDNPYDESSDDLPMRDGHIYAVPFYIFLQEQISLSGLPPLAPNENSDTRH
jgi:hypothetical protein